MDRIEQIKEILRRYHGWSEEVYTIDARQIDALYQPEKLNPYSLPSDAYDKHFTPPNQPKITCPGINCPKYRVGCINLENKPVPEDCPLRQNQPVSDTDKIYPCSQCGKLHSNTGDLLLKDWQLDQILYNRPNIFLDDKRTIAEAQLAHCEPLIRVDERTKTLKEAEHGH